MMQRRDAPREASASGDRGASIDVCHVVGSLGHGGRESLLEDIVRLSPAGIDYAICGLRVRAQHDDRFERYGIEAADMGARSDRDVRAVLRLMRYLRSRRFDVIHAHGPRAQIPCRVVSPLVGRPSVVSTIHGIPSMFPEKLLRYERLTRFLDARTVGVSEGVTRAFVGETPAPAWTTIQNGIDVDRFRRAVETADPTEILESHPVAVDDVVFLNVGRYVPPKAQLDLVDAMAHLAEDRDDVHLFIVGGRGAMESRIREAVDEEGLDDLVSVTGPVEDIHPYYGLADAFVSSSVGEGMPIVILEAMAAGLPVVATAIPGVTELVVDDRTGIIVDPQEPAELAEALRAMLDDELRDRLGQSGYERVGAEFDIQKTVDAYVGLYRDVADRRRST